ncbi:hypothetical protein DIPPA_13160 [Diplonema papillatum]|nr:hypothetical protein DIPPA_13160 [Diplonema papillatum]
MVSCDRKQSSLLGRMRISARAASKSDRRIHFVDPPAEAHEPRSSRRPSPAAQAHAVSSPIRPPRSNHARKRRCSARVPHHDPHTAAAVPESAGALLASPLSLRSDVSR